MKKSPGAAARRRVTAAGVWIAVSAVSAGFAAATALAWLGTLVSAKVGIPVLAVVAGATVYAVAQVLRAEAALDGKGHRDE